MGPRNRSVAAWVAAGRVWREENDEMMYLARCGAMGAEIDIGLELFHTFLDNTSEYDDGFSDAPDPLPGDSLARAAVEYGIPLVMGKKKEFDGPMLECEDFASEDAVAVETETDEVEEFDLRYGYGNEDEEDEDDEGSDDDVEDEGELNTQDKPTGPQQKRRKVD